MVGNNLDLLPLLLWTPGLFPATSSHWAAAPTPGSVYTKCCKLDSLSVRPPRLLRRWKIQHESVVHSPADLQRKWTTRCRHLRVWKKKKKKKRFNQTKYFRGGDVVVLMQFKDWPSTEQYEWGKRGKGRVKRTSQVPLIFFIFRLPKQN